MTEPAQSDMLNSLFTGGGEMCRLMREHFAGSTDGSNGTTWLGPVEQWPQSLRTTVSIVLSSRYPMFIFWGLHLVKLYNDAYRPILGDKHPAALGQPGPVVWPEIWDTIGPMVNQVIQTGEATWSDNLMLFMHRSGYPEEVYFTFSYSPIRDESGGVGGLFCACTETTQQVLGDRRLRTLRDLAAQAGDAKTLEVACQVVMQTLAHNPADIPFALLYLLDADGHQAHLAGTAGLPPNTPASPQTIALFESESHPWPLARVAHTAIVERVEDVVDRLGGLKVGPWDDSPHTALVLPVASPGQEGPTGLLVVGISARRALDDDYQGFLELVAGQIAAAIADARAYEAERQRAEALAEIDRAKTVFFSNISHEFRTPLTLMLAPIEDALADSDAPLPPTQRDRLDIMQRNGLRLLKLVNTLLDFSRIEAGRIQAVYEPVDLAQLTAGLASTFRSLIERAGLSFRVECPPLPDAIYVDRGMWEKIVLNLLSNAFKFTLTGTITVRLQGVADHVELMVTDTGCGIPADELPHVFERFHRVKGSQSRSFEGSGIGLSLVQELVKLHGGSLHVTSQVGQGSRFTVSIPARTAHLQDGMGAFCTLASTAMGAMPYVQEAWRWLPDEQEGSGLSSELRPELSHPPAPRSPQPTWILLVDDNADMRDYVKRLLEQRYAVEAVGDGRAALAAIHQRLPDLVLADVMLPHLDGFGLLRELRANPYTRSLPVILLSARAGEESRIEGLEAGADDYLTKPFSGRELLARVDTHLKMAQIRREAAAHEQALHLELRRQLTEIETIYQSAPIGLNVLDRDLRFVRINQRLAEINGLPVEAHIGRTVREVLPDLADTAEQLLRSILETGEPLLNVEITGETPAQPGVKRIWLESFLPLKEGDRVIGINTVCEEITERKQADAALRQAKEELENRVAERTAELRQINADLQQSESTLRSFFNSGTMMMGIVELHGNNILHISDNRASAQFFGTTSEAMQHKFASELGVSPAIIQRWITHYREAERTQAPVRFDYLHDVPEKRQWLFVSVCQIAFSPTGHPRFSYIAKDITDRKLAEAALRDSELRFRGIFDQMFQFIGLLSPDGVLLEANHTALEFAGLDRSEVVGRPFWDAFWWQISTETQTQLREAIARAAQGEFIRYEVDVQGASNTIITIDFSLRPVLDEAGQVVLLIPEGRDITERKRAERLLELQAVITRNMAEGICLVKADSGIIVYANPKFEQMFGYGPGELNGQHVSIVNYAPDHVAAEAVNQAIRSEVLQHGEATYEVHNVKKDGTPFWCSATTSIFKHPTYGDVLVAVHQDITERKQAQEQRERSLKEKEVLLKEIHHRVKNNLSIVSSLLQMQTRRTQNPQAMAILQDSQNRVASIALVHEKLYRSTDLAYIDFAQYIQDLTASLFDSYNISSGGITLNLQLDPVVLDIETAIPCGLIINELVSNALKHAFPHNRTGEIQVRFYQLTQSMENPYQQTFVLTIQDNGIGLPKDFSASTSKTLGMTLVKGLVKQIGGQFEIGGQQGAEFTMIFRSSNP